MFLPPGVLSVVCYRSPLTAMEWRQQLLVLDFRQIAHESRQALLPVCFLLQMVKKMYFVFFIEIQFPDHNIHPFKAYS